MHETEYGAGYGSEREAAYQTDFPDHANEYEVGYVGYVGYEEAGYATGYPVEHEAPFEAGYPAEHCAARDARYPTECQAAYDAGYASEDEAVYEAAQAHQPQSRSEPYWANDGQPTPGAASAAAHPHEPRGTVYGITIPPANAEAAPTQHSTPMRGAVPQRSVTPQQAGPAQQKSPEQVVRSQQPVTPRQVGWPQQPETPRQVGPTDRFVVPPQVGSAPQPVPSQQFSDPQRLRSPQLPPLCLPLPQHLASGGPGTPPPHPAFASPLPPQGASPKLFGFKSLPSSGRFAASELYPAELRPMLTRHRLRRRRHRTAASMLTGAALAFGISALRPWNGLGSGSAPSVRGPTEPSPQAPLPDVQGMPTSIALAGKRPGI